MTDKANYFVSDITCFKAGKYLNLPNLVIIKLSRLKILTLLSKK